MAEIILKTALDNSEITKAGQDAVKKITNALEGAQPKVKEAGKKLGNALEAGMKEGLKGAPQLQQQLDNVERAAKRVSIAFGAIVAAGAANIFRNVAQASLEAAINIDRQVNTLKALVGSAEAAKRRFSELVAIAQKTPGLTASLATTLDVQLRILNVTEKTINKILPAIGKLNAIAPLGNPLQFANNLTQLITQNFERQDLKELVGNSPFAGELIKQLFNVDSPTNAKAIREAAKKLGIRTVEDFFSAFARAAENNAKLQAVTESLGTQFEKLQDRLTVALAPVGEQIAKVLVPILKDLADEAERVAPIIAKVFKDNADSIKAMASAVGDLVTSLGNIITKLGELDTKIGLVKNSIRGYLVTLGLLSPGLALQLGLSFERGALREEDAAAREKAFTTGSPFLTAPDPLRGSPFLSSETRKVLEEKGKNKPTETDRKQALSELQKTVQDVNLLTKQVEALRKGEGKLFEEQAKLFEARIKEEKLKKEREELGTIAAKQRLGIPLAPRLPGISLPKLPLIAPGGPGFQAKFGLTSQDAALAGEAARTSELLTNQRLRIQEVQIQNQVTTGLLTEIQAQKQLNAVRAAARAEIIAKLEAQLKAVDANSLEGLQIQEQIEKTKLLGVELSNAQRFMRGFGAATEDVGDAFERLGQNVSRALLDTTNLLGSLKNAVLSFFNDLLGQSLQGLLRSVFAPLAGLLGGGAAAGGIGGIFRTPSTFPVNVASSFASAAFSGGGGGLAAPPSLSSPFGFGQGFGILTGGGGGSSLAHEALHAGTFTSTSKVGFLAGIGRSLGAAAPFLGVSIGAGLGGKSRLGQALGIAGGALGGTLAGVLTGGITNPAIVSAFLGPLGAIAGPLAAGLIVGAVLLGKAKQRKADEQASGEFLTQALAGIEQLASGIAADQIEGSQARGIFDSQILATFKQQIGTLKTQSVVKSRLTNQVRDLENVYQSRIPPLILEQETRRNNQTRFAAIDRRLVPQFAIGGLSSGGLAFLHSGEMVLTPGHQSAIKAFSGDNVFQRAGVPGINRTGSFDNGGIQPSFSSGATIVIEKIVLVHGMSQSGAEELVVAGFQGRNGEKLVANALSAMRTRGKVI